MIKLTKIDIFIMALFMVLVCLPDCAWAQFGGLVGSGKSIFRGLRKIIYPASAVGIICVCIGGFFGNINWKWLTAIVIGLVVISVCAGFIELFTPEGVSPDLS